MIETYAATRAARHATAVQIAVMHDCNERMEEAIHKPGNIEGLLVGNREFHALIMEAADSLRLTKMSAMIVEPIIVHGTPKRYSGFDLAQSLSEHRDLVKAFIDRDAVWVTRAIMQTHIRRAAHHFTKIAPAASSEPRPSEGR